jgi:prevent-host-death family protein
MRTATIREAQHHLSKLVDEMLETGTELILTRRGKSVVKLVPVEERRNVAFPDFGTIRAKLGTAQVDGPNEVLAQRGKSS